MFEVPGKIEREAMLLHLVEVEVSDADFQKEFGPNVIEDSEILVKRQAEGQLADDVRKRFNVPDGVPVFLTEIGGDAWIGDETVENFRELVVECNGKKMEFDGSGDERNNFAVFLKWLDEEV